MRYRLAVVLRVLSRAALRLSTLLSPPVLVSVAHPSARAALRRAAGDLASYGELVPADREWLPRGRRMVHLTGRDGSEWMVGGPMPEGVQLAPMTDPYRQEKP